MKKPDFKFENDLWGRGFDIIAGLDEVGRGCFAGPVVAGCVVFDQKIYIPPEISINDSKKITPLKRKKASIWIKENSLSWGIGEASTSLINRIGMAKASKVAFRNAIFDAQFKKNIKINFLLIDAFYIPFVKGIRRKNQKAVIHGDEQIISVAAASIIAKVYRDNYMKKLSKKFKVYAWAKNKGYGTREHQEAIIKYGLTRYHRKQFCQTFFNNSFFSQAR